MVIPKKSGGIRITVNYKKLNKISSLRQLPIPRVDQVLDSLGKGRVFSLFDLVSSFGQGTGVFPVRPSFFVPSKHRAQGHRSSNGVLHLHGPL